MTYPRARWSVKAMIGLENGGRRLRGDAFRVFVHPVAVLESTLRAAGFGRAGQRTTWTWCADLYVRERTGS